MCGRSRAGRRYDLEEAVADREDHVLESELGDTRVPERVLQAQLALQPGRHLLQIPRHQDRLAQPHAPARALTHPPRLSVPVLGGPRVQR